MARDRIPTVEELRANNINLREQLDRERTVTAALRKELLRRDQRRPQRRKAAAHG